MVLINGIEQTSIDYRDRGLQYGDGLFETILINNGTPVYLEKHLNRLFLGCQRLAIAPPDHQKLRDEIRSVSSLTQNAVQKIIVTRGVGGRGYLPSDDSNTTRIISTHPLPECPGDLFTRGISVRICQTRLGQNPFLAGIKHLNRLEQVLARAEWGDSDIKEGLLLDTSNNVVEGTMSNLFCVKDGQLYTPIIDQCGVEGIMRSVVMDLVCRHNIEVECVQLTLDDVARSDELFLTNSIIGIWPVTQLENQSFAIGSVTREIKRWIDQEKF